MTKAEAGKILQKEYDCRLEDDDCFDRYGGCDGCKNFTLDDELNEAMKIAIDALKEVDK